MLHRVEFDEFEIPKYIPIYNLKTLSKKVLNHVRKRKVIPEQIRFNDLPEEIEYVIK
jgi:hypothetical protein